MKTKDQILKHLEYTGYTKESAAKIMGYLLGLGLLEKGERVKFSAGNLDFDDFFEWVNREPEKNIFADIAANLDYLLNCDGKVPENVKQRTTENAKFLLANKDFLQECNNRRIENGMPMGRAVENCDELGEKVMTIFFT